MNFLESIILGFVQGVTEFLPVSSSGHLWIFETLVFHSQAHIALEAFFHFSTLLAVILFFQKKLWSLLQNFFSSQGNNGEKKFCFKLLIATLATFPGAFFLKPFVEFELSKEVVAGTLMITAILILISEYCRPQKLYDFSWKIAFFLGLVQGIAVIPGISRSGITIVFLLLVGIDWKKSLEISFLLSIPTIFGAFVFLLPDLQQVQFDLFVLFAGGSVAFFAALFSIWVMVQNVEKYWKYFALWCVVVAGGVFFL